jgi:type VI secretion system secreted protein Hcp
MFLKVQGVTGEAADTEHKGEIEVVSWSWGMQASTSVVAGRAGGKAAIGELHVVKRVDRSSPTLMNYLRSHKSVPEARLTVRKAGQTPLEYYLIELEDVRITALQTQSENAELVERLTLGFSKVRVSYIPQGADGGPGGGANVFEADTHVGS